MPTVRPTKRSIEALPQPAPGQMLYCDEELRGFGLRVGARSKVFFVESQVRRRTVRVTIGLYGPFTPEQARREAIARAVAAVGLASGSLGNIRTETLRAMDQETFSRVLQNVG
jgi:uncharacterized protein with GYD domain